MKMISVDSSSVSHVGYDPKTEQLHLRYKGGGDYIKHGVTQGEFERLLNAPSIGKHLHSHFKDHRTTAKK